MSEPLDPTERELEILKILWERDEATVRQVYEQMRQTAPIVQNPIVQNTVQAFLRTMEEKGLVAHRREGRTFVYRPVPRREQTNRRLAGRLLDRVFDGAMDQLVDSLLSVHRPSDEELKRLEELLAQAKTARRKRRKPKEPRS